MNTLILISLLLISFGHSILAYGSSISPYVGFGFNPIASPFYGYGLANALGFGFDHLSYYGKPWYGGYGIGYPFGNGYGLGYGMGMGYGFGFPAMNLGMGHGGVGYGLGYGVGYGAGYGAGIGPGVGGYGWINKKEGFDNGYEPMMTVSGDFHKTSRNGREMNFATIGDLVSSSASSSPSITTTTTSSPSSSLTSLIMNNRNYKTSSNHFNAKHQPSSFQNSMIDRSS